jgi:hypothetical protein
LSSYEHSPQIPGLRFEFSLPESLKSCKPGKIQSRPRLLYPREHGKNKYYSLKDNKERSAGTQPSLSTFLQIKIKYKTSNPKL